jgi:L-lactate dehydrogenase complex protein LldG
VGEARAEILARVRGALGAGTAVPEVPRSYRGAGGDGGDVVSLFCERVADYQATVRRVVAAELPAAVARACSERGARRLVTPPGGPGSLQGLELVADEPPLTPRDLDELDGVLTGCALAIAETGTVVLDGDARQGRRALSLVPDLHLCVVEADRIVGLVPEAVAGLQEAAREGRPLTFVSGPSATSDIELDRVEGVHGPRTLDVVILA